MKRFCCFLFSLILAQQTIHSQPTPLNRQQFFLDDNIIDVTLTTDIRKLRGDKRNSVYIPAHITMQFPDSLVISEDIRLQPRGIYRKTYCDIAALTLNFKNSSSPLLSPLKKLKLVGGCRNSLMYDELLLKEYMVYKIQNFLSNMSFRVRLLHVTYKDSREKVRSYTQYAFLIEDMSDMAARNNCVEVKNDAQMTEATNREQMTFVNLFQYMIGNTDWSVPKRHNIKLMAPKNDTLARPYAIPYDFDYAGIVDADYAVPSEELEIKSVRERLYRGFPRGYDELKAVIDVFEEKKEGIMYYINHADFCSQRCKKDMINYLEQFYQIIEDRKKVESVFIANARAR